MKLPACLRFALLAQLIILAASPCISQEISAEELLANSIAYHDPQGRWGRLQADLVVKSTRPGGSDRLSYISMDQPRSYFAIRVERDGKTKEYTLSGSDCRLAYQGSASFSDQVAHDEDMTCERGRFWRDYYMYLYGLPMKLRDPGTILDPEVARREFHGKEYLVLKVTYDPKKGADTWFFYLDPDTHALGAYQFYHDMAENDGEYILLEGEALVGGMRLPKTRKWYRNDSGEFLGADILLGRDTD